MRLTQMWALLLPSLVSEERWDDLKDLPADVQRERAAAAA
jgi:hypothetical protein